MEETVCISSDSNDSSSPAVIAADLDDDFEFPSAKLSEICETYTGLRTVREVTDETPKGDVSGCAGKSGVSKRFLSSWASPKEQSASNFMVPGQLSGAVESRTNGCLLKTISFHELSDSDCSDDATQPDSPKSTFEAMSGGGNLARDSPIWDLIGETKVKRTATAPSHELSDSDSDRTIPAVGSPRNIYEIDENARLPSADTLPPERLSPKGDFISISDDDSPTIRLSNSSFKLDIPLPPNSASCDTLPPRSPNPFGNLSDESTQPFSSTSCPPVADNDLIQSNSEPLFSTSYGISEFVTQLGTNSQPLDLNRGPKPPRKRTKNSAEDILERKRLKEMKEKEKAEKAAAVETIRRLRPVECLKVGSSTPVEENHIIFLWSVDKLLTSIQFGTFIDTFSEFKQKYSTRKLLLAVYGLYDYYKKQHQAEQRKKRSGESRNPNGPPARKRKTAYEVTEVQIEMELIGLQVRLGISHKALNSPQDAACFLQMITKSVAELPFKLERERIDEERNWYAKGDSRNCVRIDKDFRGLSQLWLQQLAQYNNSSLDTAKAVAQIYPSPLSLYNEYKEKATTKEKEQMLQDIVIRRGSSGGGRRLGPELSKKISIMFCQEEDVPLG